MIKVNLLKNVSDGAHKHKKSSVSVPKLGGGSGGGGSLLWIWGVAHLLALAVLGFMWQRAGKNIETAKREQAELRQEEQRLQAMRQELVKFEELKAQRQSRIDAIQRLKEAQKGPVSLLNAIIQAVPPKGSLWLTLLEQKEREITVKGATRTPEVLPDLMNNLTGSGLFASVDINEIKRNEGVSDFTITCTGNQPVPAE